MRILLLGCCLFYLFVGRVQMRPQITKLFPISELVTHRQQEGNEVRPVDKFLEKLRATYNFVFQKPGNASDMENAMNKSASSNDADASKLIWAQFDLMQNKTTTENPSERVIQKINSPSDAWLNDVQPLSALELEEEARRSNDGDIEILTPATTLQLPTNLGRHLIDLVGFFLDLTHTICKQLGNVIQSNQSDP